MKLLYQTSETLELIRTFETEIKLGDATFPLRIELFQGSIDKRKFRCHIFEHEMYRIQPTFPQSEDAGQPKRKSCDVGLLVRGSGPYDDLEDFEAPTIDEAVLHIQRAIDKVSTHIMGI